MARAVTVLLAACAAVASAVGNGIHKSGIYEIEPRRGSAQGGTKVTIKGYGFAAGGLDGTQDVLFGNVPCDVEQYNSNDGQIVCYTRPQNNAATGWVDVTVSLFAPGIADQANCHGSCSFYYGTGYEQPRVQHADRSVAAGDNYHMHGYMRGTALADFTTRFGEATCAYDHELYADLAAMTRDREAAPTDELESFPNRARWGDYWWWCGVPNTPAGRHQRYLRVDESTGYGGGAAAVDHGLRSVDPVTDEAWDVTVVPVVESTSIGQGGANGGATLVVTGTGFDPEAADRNTVMVGTAPCAVEAVTSTDITCTLGAAPASDDTTSRLVPAGHGLIRREWDSDSFAGPPSSVQVHTNALVSARATTGEHSDTSSRQSYAEEWTGFFVPPLSADYAFTAFADDGAEIWLSTDADPANAVKVADSFSYNSSLADAQAAAIKAGVSPRPVSSWRSLTAGTPYWFKATHIESWGGDFFKGGLRIRDALATAADHPVARAESSLPEVWEVDLRTNVVREVQEITFLGLANDSPFKFRANGASSFHEDAAAMTGASSTGHVANQLKHKVYPGCGSVSVSKTSVGPAAGASETPAQTAARLAATGWKYTITVHCPRNGNWPGFEARLTQAASRLSEGGVSASSWDISTWTRVRGPSTPLSGTWTMSAGGQTSAPLSNDASTGQVANAVRDLFGWSTNVPDTSVVQVTRDGNGADSRRYVITIISPAGGRPGVSVDGSGLEGSGARAEADTIWNGDADTWVTDAIPMQYFRTALDRDPATSGSVAPALPVTVAVNGVGAACNAADFVPGSNFSCTFTYDATLTPAVSSITPATGQAGDSLTITGTGFGSDSDAVSVTLGEATCAATAVTDTSITCTLSHGNAGVHTVQVLVAGGIGLATSAVTFTYTQSVTSVSPATGSYAGGSLLTISGTGFSADPAQNNVYVGAWNTAADACVVKSASHTTLTCVVPSGLSRRAIRARALATAAADVHVNADGSVATFTYDDAVTPDVTALAPSTLSTAVSGTVTITTDITPDSTPVQVTFGDRPCTDLTMTGGVITCTLLRGEPSGSAIVAPTVFVPGQGNARTNGHTLDTTFAVTGLSMTSGSWAGGAIVTVTGSGFANRSNTNEALLIVEGSGWSEQRGRFEGEILSFSPTSIVFRVPPVVVPTHVDPDGTLDTLTARLDMRTNRVVAACDLPGGAACEWTWRKDATGACSGVDQSGDPRVLTITGTTLAGTSDVKVGGKACTVTSATATSITCDLPALPIGSYSVVVTTPAGTATCPDASATYDLAVDSVTPTTGSNLGGTEVTITGWGFETASRGNFVNFGNTPGIITSSSPTSITVLSPVLPVGNHPITVAVQTTDGAAVQNVPDVATWVAPTATAGIGSVTPATVTPGTTLTLAGIGLGNATGSVFLGGAECAVATWTDTAITCSVANPPAGAYVPVVFGAGNTGRIGVDPAGATLTTALTVSGVSGTGGFGGNAQLTISGSGFSAATASAGETDPSGSNEHPTCANSPNAVKVCGVPAVVESATSTSLTVRTPRLVTPSSLDTFASHQVNVIPPAPGAPLLGDDIYASIAAFDGSLQSVVDDVSPDCAVGLDVGAGSAAILTRIRWYATWRRFSAPVGGSFQGSNDGTTWTDIATITQRPTEGWNVITLVGVGGVHPEGTALGGLPSWRFLRFAAQDSGAQCRFNEVEFIGVTVSTAAAAGACDVEVAPPENCGSPEELTAPATRADAVTSAAAVTLTAANTPYVTGVTPDHVGSLGGSTVTLSGTGFGSVSAGVTVALNGVPCSVTAVVDTAITCTTSARDLSAIAPPSIVVNVPGRGDAEVALDVRFRYLDPWSAATSWRFGDIPRPGDSVIIPPGQALLLDTNVDVFLLVVQGELIWDTAADGLTLDATYIMVHGGRFEVGTETAPMMNHATITLHGDRYKNIEIPQIGAKVLAVLDRAGTDTSNGAAVSADAMGFLDVHGPPMRRAWTLLKKDAHVLAGTNEFELANPVDWPVGATVVLPSTSTRFSEAEEVVLAAALNTDGDGFTTRYRIQGTFKHDHRADVFEAGAYGHSDMDMRGEVGLLTRKVVIQGDEWSTAQNFGAHTMAMGGGTYRISHTEVRRCGQSFLLGRYCTHGHMAGEFSRSYVQSNSIHHSFQRITTIHGVRHFNVKHNFGYHVKGHSIFVEDGAEEFNVIEENLVAVTLKCTACLKSDIKPASFWTASPRQFWRHNRAAGCTNDGYWLELPGHPHGPSFTQTICPVHDHLGGFFNNTAHSNGVHGLRLYPVVLPYHDPCADRPNPFQMYFYNFTSFRNGNHGIFGKKNGDLHHINPKLGENSMSDLFWTKLIDVKYHADDPNVVNGLFLGRMNGVTPTTDLGKAAIWNPQNEFMHVKDVTFINYGASGALRGCAKCDDQTALKQGGYTVRTQGLTFVNTAKRVLWTGPKKTIFYDLDGTLTGMGPATWLSAPWSFNEFAPHCSVGSADTYDSGILCDSNVEVRRMQINRYAPDDLRGYRMDVAPRDAAGNVMGHMKASVSFRYKELAGWVFPLVTRRWVHFELDTIMDWEKLQIRYSEPDYVGTHVNADEWVGLSTNWTSYRWRNKVLYGNDVTDYWGQGETSVNETEIRPLGAIDEFPDEPVRMPEPTDVFGTGYIPTTPGGKNDTWYVMLNNVFNASAGQPWDTDVARYGTHRIFVKNIQCRPGACQVPGAEALEGQSLWSDAETWEHMRGEWDIAEGAPNRLPAEGDDVYIPPTKWVVLDVDTPVLAKLNVSGRLTLDDTKAITLNVHNLGVIAPTASPDAKGIYIGSPDEPRVHPATIRFHGWRESDALILDNSQFLDNKVMGVFANVSVHGAPVTTPWTRLDSTAAVGDTSVTLTQRVPEWSVGQQIVITPTGDDPDAAEVVTLTAVDHSGSKSVLTFTPALTAEHFAGVQTLAGEAVELRAAVGMLTRSIKFEAVLDPDHDEVDEVSNPSNRYPDMYGFHVHVGEFGKDVDFGDGEQRLDYVGKLHLSNVQFIGGGQMGMQHSAIWVDYRKRDGSVDDDSPATADARPVNTISNCAFVSSWNRILRVEGDVPGLEFEDNVVSQAYDSAVFFAKAGSHGARINRNLIASVRYNIDLPDPAQGQEWIYPFAGIYMFGRPASMAGNLVAGSADQGMTFRPELCVPGQDQSPAGAVIVDNEVVSSLIGMFMIGAHLSERVHCQRLVRAKVWRASHIGVFTTDQTSHMLLHDVTVADSHIGVSLNYFRSASKSYSWIVDSTIIGTSEAGSCSACHTMTADDPRGEGACASTVSGNHRVGILVPQYTNRAKTCFSDVTSLLPPEACWPPTLPERLCNMPWEQRHGLMVTRHQELHITGTKLLNFKAEECGSGSFAIKFNPTQSEAAVPITISGADWTGTDEDAKVSLHMESNTDAKCRTRGCDSFDYMYIKDTDGSSFGASGGIVLRDPTYTVGHTCTSKPAWGQGLLCTGDITASHAFVSESLDRDRGFRRLEPIAMQRPEASGTVARYGAHGPLDDNCAKRFYFGQQHGLVMPSDGVTVMNVTGTLPGRWRMHWFSTDPAEAFVLGLFIRRPYRMNVYVGNTLVAPITTVDTLPTTADPAGTNVFIPQSLTLWLTFRGHEDFPPITVVRQTEVQLDMTLAMSVDEFYGSNVKRNLATLLNIPPDRIQEADVQAASTKVSFIIIPANGRVDPGPGSEPDGRTPTTGDRVDPTTCEYDEDTGSVVAGSCTAHEPDQYEANVAELYGHVDTIVGRMRAGTFSEAIGAEVLGMEINAPPRGTENTADEDEAGFYSLRETQSSTSDSGLDGLAIALISVACVVAVVAVVAGFVLYRRSHGAHVRGVVRNKGRRHRTGAKAPGLRDDSGALDAANPLETSGKDRFKRGSLQGKVTAGKRGGRRGSNMTTKVASSPTAVRQVRNHRGELVSGRFA